MSFDKTQTQIGSLNLAYDFGKVTLRSLTSIGSYRASGLADQLTDTFTPDALAQLSRCRSWVRSRITAPKCASNRSAIRSSICRPAATTTRVTPCRTAVSGVGPTFTKVSLKNRNEQYTEDFAGFGLAQVNITSKLRLNGEVRYTTDANHANITNLITGVSNSPATTFNYFTYRASADYRWSGDFLTYASVATGEKSGGFNNTPVVTEQTFGPEKNTTYEAGFKTQLFDHRLALEAAGFYIDWKRGAAQRPIGGDGERQLRLQFRFGDGGRFRGWSSRRRPVACVVVERRGVLHQSDLETGHGGLYLVRLLPHRRGLRPCRRRTEQQGLRRQRQAAAPRVALSGSDQRHLHLGPSAICNSTFAAT